MARKETSRRLTDGGESIVLLAPQKHRVEPNRSVLLFIHSYIRLTLYINQIRQNIKSIAAEKHIRLRFISEITNKAIPKYKNTNIKGIFSKQIVKYFIPLLIFLLSIKNVNKSSKMTLHSTNNSTDP